MDRKLREIEERLNRTFKRNCQADDDDEVAAARGAAVAVVVVLAGDL